MHRWHCTGMRQCLSLNNIQLCDNCIYSFGFKNENDISFDEFILVFIRRQYQLFIDLMKLTNNIVPLTRTSPRFA